MDQGSEPVLLPGWWQRLGVVVATIAAGRALWLIVHPIVGAVIFGR